MIQFSRKAVSPFGGTSVTSSSKCTLHMECFVKHVLKSTEYKTSVTYKDER
jgi:hypothetical protein